MIDNLFLEKANRFDQSYPEKARLIEEYLSELPAHIQLAIGATTAMQRIYSAAHGQMPERELDALVAIISAAIDNDEGTLISAALFHIRQMESLEEPRQ